MSRNEKNKDKDVIKEKEEDEEENIKSGDRERKMVEPRHIKDYKKLKENWIRDLKSLKNLYEHGSIGEDEYEKSKSDIEEKIGKVETLIKRELEREELED